MLAMPGPWPDRKYDLPDGKMIAQIVNNVGAEVPHSILSTLTSWCRPRTTAFTSKLVISALHRCFKWGKNLSDVEAQLISKSDLFIDAHKEIFNSLSNDLTILKLIFNNCNEIIVFNDHIILTLNCHLLTGIFFSGFEGFVITSLYVVGIIFAFISAKSLTYYRS